MKVTPGAVTETAWSPEVHAVGRRLPTVPRSFQEGFTELLVSLRHLACLKLTGPSFPRSLLFNTARGETAGADPVAVPRPEKLVHRVPHLPVSDPFSCPGASSVRVAPPAWRPLPSSTALGRERWAAAWLPAALPRGSRSALRAAPARAHLCGEVAPPSDREWKTRLPRPASQAGRAALPSPAPSVNTWGWGARP